MKRLTTALCSMLVLCTVLPAASALGHQEEEERDYLLLYFSEQEISVVSATRSLKSVSRVAENVSVITAQELELMNAHTVADALNTVSGVQVHTAGGGPGSAAGSLIQGSYLEHVTILLDGIPLNNLSSNTTDLGAMSVQFIERIEIIKGPASSSWGPSLGGVINIITKPPGRPNETKGTLSVSYGERDTADLRAEASGGKGRLGYYLFAGGLRTAGMTTKNDFSGSNLFGMLSFDITERNRLLLSLLYLKNSRGDGEFKDFGLSLSSTGEMLHASLTLSSRIRPDLDLSFSIYSMRNLFGRKYIDTGSGAHVLVFDDDERRAGANARMTWSGKSHTLVLGAEHDDGSMRANTVISGRQDLRRWAVFANDTMQFGRLSLTPGLRYDKTDLFDDFVSPSLGMTYRLADSTILRAFVARGFNIPALGASFVDDPMFISNPDLEVEKVWSYQAGGETTALRYLWLKAVAFRHDITDGTVSEAVSRSVTKRVNKERVRRQGIEIEIRTMPIHDFTLSAGATFMDSRDMDTDKVIVNSPEYTYDLAVRYDDRKSLKALLKGRYTWWNGEPGLSGRYSSMIFDLSLTKRIYRKDGLSLDAFFSVHNILNGSQHVFSFYRNAGRWIEGGIRYTF